MEDEQQIPQELLDVENNARAIATQDCEQGYCSLHASYVEKRATSLAYHYCPKSQNFNAEDRRAFVDAYCERIEELKMQKTFDEKQDKRLMNELYGKVGGYDSIDYSLMKQLLLKVCNAEGDYFRELLSDLYKLESDREYFQLSGEYHPMYHKFYESLVKKSFVVGTLDDVIEHFHRLIDKESHELINAVMPGPEEE